MAAENGYASEQYTIVTEDGYVSQLFRLPGKIGEAGAGTGGQMKKPAVLMMHGIECDMNFFTVNDAAVAPPYVLVEQGYDVWLGNNRGNRYARGHTTLAPDSDEYWDFNQEQYGRYDVPAFIDHILEVTG